jgi:hypothetical protein
MALIDSLIVFLVSAAIGAFGIHIGALIVTGESDYTGALVTALIGALIWSIVSFFLGWILLLGPILALLAWIEVINSRYEGGWINAAFIGLTAWAAVFVILYILAAFDISAFEAIGVPGI